MVAKGLWASAYPINWMSVSTDAQTERLGALLHGLGSATVPIRRPDGFFARPLRPKSEVRSPSSITFPNELPAPGSRRSVLEDRLIRPAP